MEIYYRYSDILFTNGPQIVLQEYNVIKHTKKGVWVESFGYKRFVLTDARKAFARPTKEEARRDFIARKQRQLRIYKSRIENVEKLLEAIKTFDNETTLLK